jgi:hypothetical protein
MKTKNKKWLYWVVGGIIALVAIWFFFIREKEIKIQLETVKPEMGEISNSITATGTIQPVDTVAVGTQVSGIIKNIYVDFNSTVKKDSFWLLWIRICLNTSQNSISLTYRMQRVILLIMKSISTDNHSFIKWEPSARPI